MKAQLREQAVNFRTNENLSYSEIRKRLDVAKSTLSYWLREFPLSEERILELRRQGWKRGEASRERFRNTMRKKQEIKNKAVYECYRKKFKNLSEENFFIAGLMLYLGEGDKRNYAQTALSNTDPNIIKFFIKWLVQFFDVERAALKIQLHLYENMDIEKEEQFWRNALNLPKEQFYNSAIRKLKKASFSYKESFRHGTCQAYLLGVEKKRNLLMALKALVDLYIKN